MHRLQCQGLVGKITVSTILSACVFVGSQARVARADEAQLEVGSASDVAIPRDAANAGELLKLFGIDEKFWEVFEPDQELSPAERSNLLPILYRLGRFSTASLARFARSDKQLDTSLEDPEDSRGVVLSISGQVTRITREPLDAEEQIRLELDAVYRCELTIAGGAQAIVYVLAVPAELKLDAMLDARAGAVGLLVKRLAPPRALADGLPATAPRFLFAAKRLSWYPHNLLGDAGLDFGLLDDVRDRTRLTERDAFYAMLAAVRRIPASDIEIQAFDNLRVLRKHLREFVADHDLSGQQRLAARRALARAERDASDVVPLFNDPAEQRGKLFVLRGEAMRAVKVRVDDPNVVERLGADHYYEVSVFTEDSQNHPLVCCVAELPDDMPRGETIRENVTICAFFFKSWAYGASPLRSDDPQATTAASRRQSAPLLIARTLTWAPAASLPGADSTATVAILGALVATILALWLIARPRQRAVPLGGYARESLPVSVNLDALSEAADDRSP